jgi:hypothetical protein
MKIYLLCPTPSEVRKLHLVLCLGANIAPRIDLLLCIAAVVHLLMVGMPQLRGHILKVCPSSTSNPQVKQTFILLYCFTMFE